MIFFKVALLNIKAHGKRTAVILFAVGLSVLVMVFVESLMKGMQSSFFERIYQDSGHIQIHKKGFSDSLEPYPLEYSIENQDEIIDKIKETEKVAVTEPLILFGSLLFNNDINLPALGIGITEESRYYRKALGSIKTGSGLRDRSSILISKQTAGLLETDTGAPLIVLSQDSTGSPFYMEFTVSGLFETGNQQFDTNHFFITHSAAQELLYLGEGTLEIRINLENPDQAGSVKKELSGILNEHDLEAETWREIHGSFIVAFELFDLFIWFIDLLVIIVTATVITNAILMNVFERTGEYGSLRALGLKKRQQAGMIVTEGTIQGILGSFGGLVFGIGLTLLAARSGINAGNFTESFGISRIIYPELTVLTVVRSFIAGIIISAAGSLYAAYVSSRKNITAMLADQL
ncbi:MAG: ABC transporter permease [Spirochaetia bacterium]